jgi:hypothetical protein
MNHHEIVKSGNGFPYHLPEYLVPTSSHPHPRFYITEAKVRHVRLSCQVLLTAGSKGCSNGQIFTGIMPNLIVSHSPFVAYLF